MNITWLNSIESLPFSQSNETRIFNRMAWFSLLEKHISKPDFKAYYLTAEHNSKEWLLPFAQIKEDLQSFTNYYSPFYQVLANEEFSKSEFQALISQGKEAFLSYGVIDLLPLYQNDMQLFAQAFKCIGFKVFVYQQSVNWYHDNIKDIDHYWSLRPSQLRNTLKRKKNKITKSGDYQILIASPKNIGELIQYLADYHHVYYDSWKPIEPYPAFIDSLAKYAWRLGELRLGLVYHCEQPVAAQIWFVNGDTAYIFKLVYRQSYTKTSVGTVLTAAMMEHVIEQDKVSCVDFLTGDDNYKKDWMQSQRPLFGIQACNLAKWHGQKTYLRNVLSGIKRHVRRK